MCGPNSTGKTYVSYILYTLFSKMLRTADYMIHYIDISLREDVKSSILAGRDFEVTEYLVESVLNAVAASFKKKLIPSIFAISDDMANTLFSDFDFEIKLNDGEFQRIVAQDLSLIWLSAGKRLKVTKDTDSLKVSVVVTSINDESPEEARLFEDVPYIDKLICVFLLRLVFGEKGYSRMLTVERNSVYTFSKELSLNRSFGMGDLVALKSNSEQVSPERYPMAVTDSLKIAVDLQQIQKTKGYYYDYASRLEKNLLNGDIEINENGAVEFVPASRSETSNHLPIQMTSSIVKTMSSLIIYLKHIAEKEDLLIIDEPEMNLHPDNQRLLTRVFAELINKGLNLVVSTHSDYIIRELNNLIMANEIVKRKIKLEDGEHIPYTSVQMLSRRKTEVLYFNVDKHTGMVSGKELPVSEFGFDVESIDNTIISQNKDTHNLADILKYGESNE